MSPNQSGSLAQYLREVADPAWAADLPDAELLRRFLDRRDEAAFAALVRRHGPAVLAVCRRVLRHPQDSEDAFQATFLVLLRSGGLIRRRQSVGSFLHGVAHRVAVRARSDRARRSAREAEVPPRPDPSAFDPAAGGELRAALDEEVRGLPERCRLPFVLCYLEGKTNAEAARLLGCPKGTVLSRLALARRLLRARLTRRGLAVGAGLAAVTTEASAAVPAALVRATARAAWAVAEEGADAGALPASVRALTERVVKAMWTTQLKFVAALILAVGLVGGGIGVVVHRARGGGAPAAAMTGAGAEPAGEPGPNRPAAAAPADQLKKARDEAEDLERLLQKREEVWAEELLKAQLSVQSAQDGQRELERQFAQARERERADIKQVEDELREHRKAARQDPEKEKVALAELSHELQTLDDRQAERERVRAQTIREISEGRVMAESRLRLLERQQAEQRARARQLLQRAEERVDRLRDLEEGRPPPDRPDRREADLERKMDRILEELGGLRRELRRRPGGKPDRPEQGP